MTQEQQARRLARRWRRLIWVIGGLVLAVSLGLLLAVSLYSGDTVPDSWKPYILLYSGFFVVALIGMLVGAGQAQKYTRRADRSWTEPEAGSDPDDFRSI